MVNIKSSNSFTGAGLLSAVAASLCCIAPFIALLAGGTGIASNVAWIEPARPYLIAISIAVLAFAWYLKLKPVNRTNVECCETSKKQSFFHSKSFLAIVTVFAILMMAFPLYAKRFYPESKATPVTAVTVSKKQEVKFNIQGMTCEACEQHVDMEIGKVPGVLAFKTSYADNSTVVTFDTSKADIKTIVTAINKTGYTVNSYDVMTGLNSSISFYDAPLVCQAAPTIGCGSKAKFILTDLEKYSDAVNGAWLNKTGTVVAVKWNANTNASKKREIINAVSSNHNIGLNIVSSAKANNYTKTLSDTNQWYKSREVDKLSKEEALIIAKNTVAGYKKEGLIKPSFESQLQADIAKIYENLFLSLSSYQDLTTEAYNKVEEQIQRAGEKYVGKGKMPRVELCIDSNGKCEKDKSCSQNSGKSCCEKE